MKSTELRIGNLIYQYIKDEGFYLNTVDEDTFKSFIYHNEDGWDIDESYYEPIPLTEEWLVKFGFEITTDPENVHYKLPLVGEFNESFVINRKVGYSVFYVPHVDCNNYLCFTTQVKSINELQNLVFALTGEELTIK